MTPVQAGREESGALPIGIELMAGGDPQAAAVREVDPEDRSIWIDLHALDGPRTVHGEDDVTRANGVDSTPPFGRGHPRVARDARIGRFDHPDLGRGVGRAR